MAASAGCLGSRTTCCCAGIWRARNRTNWAMPSAPAAPLTRTNSATEDLWASLRSAHPTTPPDAVGWAEHGETHLAPAMTNTLLTLHDPAAAVRYSAEGLWRKETLYALACRHAAQRPDEFALRDGTRRLTWRELHMAVDAVAADLHAAG